MKLNPNQITRAAKYFTMADHAYYNLKNIIDEDSLDSAWPKFLDEMAQTVGDQAIEDMRADVDNWRQELMEDDKFCIKEITQQLPWLVLAPVT